MLAWARIFQHVLDSAEVKNRSELAHNEHQPRARLTSGVRGPLSGFGDSLAVPVGLGTLAASTAQNPILNVAPVIRTIFPLTVQPLRQGKCRQGGPTI